MGGGSKKEKPLASCRPGALGEDTASRLSGVGAQDSEAADQNRHRLLFRQGRALRRGAAGHARGPHHQHLLPRGSSLDGPSPATTGKDCVQKGIPFAKADDALVELIKKHGKWAELP